HCSGTSWFHDVPSQRWLKRAGTGLAIGCQLRLFRGVRAGRPAPALRRFRNRPPRGHRTMSSAWYSSDSCRTHPVRARNYRIEGNGNNNPTTMETKAPSRRSKRLAIRELLKPHIPSLLLGLFAVAGEGAANLLEPWPLKIVLDNVLRSQQSHAAIMQHIQKFV